jgi:hypothetical protein
MLVTLKLFNTGNGYKDFYDDVFVNEQFDPWKLKELLSEIKGKCGVNKLFFNTCAPIHPAFCYYVLSIDERFFVEGSEYVLSKGHNATRPALRSIETIVSAFNQSFVVQFDELCEAQKKKCRKKKYVYLKQLFYSVCDVLTTESQDAIASLFGKDHDDFNYGIRTVKKLISVNDIEIMQGVKTLSIILQKPNLLDLINKRSFKRYLYLKNN